MDIIALFSGGKDSTYASYLAKKQGHNIKYLVSIISENPDSYMFHTPNILLAEKQAEAMNIPIILKSTKGEKEKELLDLESAIGLAIKRNHSISGIVCGAVASEYQRSRVAAIADKFSIALLSPLWHKDPEKLLTDMITAGFKIIITSVSAQGLDKSWLGRIIDKRAVKDLAILNKEYGIHILAEGGEYETFVLDCPLFNKRIEIEKAEKHWDDKLGCGRLEIKKIRIARKAGS
ncbi:MAG: diphthine--ammonia ligase [Candidatus Aenigmatarchaeota archaeon]|nr:MAG: diphthine--ammonia ligase [Candidatus Aenigmarchaeota archaeon]